MNTINSNAENLPRVRKKTHPKGSITPGFAWHWGRSRECIAQEASP